MDGIDLAARIAFYRLFDRFLHLEGYIGDAVSAFHDEAQRDFRRIAADTGFGSLG